MREPKGRFKESSGVAVVTKLSPSRRASLAVKFPSSSRNFRSDHSKACLGSRTHVEDHYFAANDRRNSIGAFESRISMTSLPIRYNNAGDSSSGSTDVNPRQTKLMTKVKTKRASTAGMSRQRRSRESSLSNPYDANLYEHFKNIQRHSK